MPVADPVPVSVLPPALVAFAAGVVLLQWQPALPELGPPLGGAALAAGATFAFRVLGRRSAIARILAAGCAVLASGALGFGYAAWRADARLADALPTEWEGADVAVVGVVDELPQSSERGTRFAFAVERTETAGATVPARLSLAWYAQWQKGGSVVPVPGIAAGERWRLVVRLKRPHGTVNPHGFDIEAWLLENGLRATGYVRTDDRNARLDAFAGRASDYVQRTRENIRARILAALPDAPYAGVIVALTIGDQRAIPEAHWRVFNRTGIAHLISISGLHVTVFATLAGAVAFAFARRCVALTSRIPARKVAAAAGVVFATGYVLLAGAQVPAVRTLLMLIVAAVGLVVARPGTAAVIWLWALAIVVAWDPWAGLTPGLLALFRGGRRAPVCGRRATLLAAAGLALGRVPRGCCASRCAGRRSSPSPWFPGRSRCSSRCRSCRRSPTRWRFRSSPSPSCRSRSSPSCPRWSFRGRSPMRCSPR